MSKGFIYIAFGDEHVKQFIKSFNSLRESGNNEPVIVVGQGIPPGNYTIIEKICPPGAYGSRFWKTQIGNLSNWDTTIFLDCDTKIIKKLTLWNKSKHYKIGMAKDRLSFVDRFTETKFQDQILENKYMILKYNKNVTFYNCGVIVWDRCKETQKLFFQWHKEWLKFKNQDQPAMARSIQKTGIKIKTIPAKYNRSASFKWLENPKNTEILHFHGGRKILWIN